MAGLVYSRIHPFHADGGGGFAEAGYLRTHLVTDEELKESKHDLEVERRKQRYHPQ